MCWNANLQVYSFQLGFNFLLFYPTGRVFFQAEVKQLSNFLKEEGPAYFTASLTILSSPCDILVFLVFTALFIPSGGSRVVYPQSLDSVLQEFLSFASLAFSLYCYIYNTAQNSRNVLRIWLLLHVICPFLIFRNFFLLAHMVFLSSPLLSSIILSISCVWYLRTSFPTTFDNFYNCRVLPANFSFISYSS